MKTSQTTQSESQKTALKRSSTLNFARDILFFSSARVLGTFVNLVRSFVLARHLGPELFGTWQFINLFTNYSPYASLGTQSALSRRIPFLRGKGDISAQYVVIGTAFITHIFTSIFYTIIVVTLSFLLKEAFTSYALLLFSPVILLLSWLHYAKLLSLSLGYYSFRSRLELTYDLSSGILAISLIYFLGLRGVIIAFALSGFLSVLISLIKLRKYLIFNVDWGVLLDLMMTGIPLMLNGLLITLAMTIDRILISLLLGTGVLGIYSVANIGVSVLRVIPTSIAQILVVRFSEMDGSNTSKSAVAASIDKYTSILSCMSSILVSAVISFFPIIITFWLPDFIEGIPAGRILIANVFFLGVSVPVTNWCISAGHFAPVLTLRMMTVFLELCSIYLVIYSGAKIEYIAICVLMGSAIYTIMIWVVTTRILNLNTRDGVSKLVKVLSPFTAIIFIILMQIYVYKGSYPVLLLSSIVSSTVMLVATIILTVAISYFTNREIFGYVPWLRFWPFSR